MDLVTTCGQLVVGGFGGTSLPPAFARALRERRRGGAILFKPNVEGGLAQVAALTRELHAAMPEAPLVGIDQEGGRVTRLRGDVLDVPPMRTVAAWGDVALAERIAAVVGAELASLGFTIDFAPVLDVNTCAGNPVIGDRAFGDDAATCARFGVAWIRGLQQSGLLACGKHFPGHGDTSKDSHLDLPQVVQPLQRIEQVELRPFREAVAAGVASLMTAHVVYSAIDSERPATLSPSACTDLRGRIGFGGMLFSDDLEMKAIADRWSIEEASVQAVAAGCDALLVCRSDEKQERAVGALVKEAEASRSFRSRCEEACRRTIASRRRARVAPPDVRFADVIGGTESRAVADAISRKLSA
jgi:beta-N-acetylhexosaminidase